MEQTSFQARIESFEGPLDLMLHLVRENRLDLFDLDLDVLASQYIAYIQAQENLDLASEFLVEMSRLLEYKSARLLPAPAQQEQAQEIVDEYSDRLLEYKSFKEAAQKLQEFYEQASRQLYRPADSLVGQLQKRHSTLYRYPSVQKLMQVFEQVMEQARPTAVESLEYRELDVARYVRQIESSLQEGSRPIGSFFAPSMDRAEIIVTFLALLELIHSAVLTVKGDDLVYEPQPGS